MFPGAFASPTLIVLDSIRLLLAVAGGFIAGYQLRLIVLARTPGQKARLAGIAVALVVLAASRVQNLGDPLTWQAVGAALAIGLLGYGSYAFRNEIPATMRGEKPRPPGTTRHRTRR